MNKKSIQLLTALAAGACFTASAMGQIIFTIDWNTAGYDSTGGPPLPGVSDSALITPLALTRGPGINSASLADAFSSNGWDSTTGGEYFQFGFTVASGYQADLTELLTAFRATNTGPGNISLVASFDGFDTSSFVEGFALSGGTWLNATIGLAAFENVTGTVLFRVVKTNEIAANGNQIASGGTFALGRFSGDDGLVPISLTGTIPEPSTYAAIVGALFLGLVLHRRRQNR